MWWCTPNAAHVCTSRGRSYRRGIGGGGTCGVAICNNGTTTTRKAVFRELAQIVFWLRRCRSTVDPSLSPFSFCRVSTLVTACSQIQTRGERDTVSSIRNAQRLRVQPQHYLKAHQSCLARAIEMHTFTSTLWCIRPRSQPSGSSSIKSCSIV